MTPSGQLATEWKVPLRLMSLVAVGEDSRHEWAELAQRHAAALVTKVEAAMGEATSVIGHGDSIRDAVRGVDFADDEVVVIGSSRLAQPKRLFVGHSASKIMRALKVPMIVWPRD